MSLGYLLLWFVGIGACRLLLQSLNNRVNVKMSWAFVALTIIGSMAAIAYFDKDLAGYVGLVEWFLLVETPRRLFKKIETAWFCSDFVRVHTLSKRLRYFHPGNGLWKLPDLTSLLLSQISPIPDSLFRAGATFPNQLSRGVVLELFTRHRQWNELVAWIEQNLDESLRAQPLIFYYYLWGLGEIGDYLRFNRVFATWLGWSQKRDTIEALRMRLLSLAFRGEVSQLEQLLSHAGEVFPPAERAYWLAKAQNSQIPLRGIEDLTAATISEEKPPWGASPVAAPTSRAWATLVLIGLNLLAFAFEIYLGGSQEIEVLFVMGGLYPQAVVEYGQWWRLLAANFLHSGPLHLGMNLFALWVLGYPLEKIFGWVRYCLIYILSGVLCMGAVTLLVYTKVMSAQFLVGASGSISGLVGAMGAILLKAWRVERTHIAWQRLKSIGFAILLQTAFDLATPQVSLTAHLSGAIFGFILGWLLSPSKPQHFFR